MFYGVFGLMNRRLIHFMVIQFAAGDFLLFDGQFHAMREILRQRLNVLAFTAGVAEAVRLARAAFLTKNQLTKLAFHPVSPRRFVKRFARRFVRFNNDYHQPSAQLRSAHRTPVIIVLAHCCFLLNNLTLVSLCNLACPSSDKLHSRFMVSTAFSGVSGAEERMPRNRKLIRSSRQRPRGTISAGRICL